MTRSVHADGWIGMLRRLGAVAWKEIVQLRRDRITLGMIVGIPVMQFLLFGFAIDTDVRHLPLVIDDQDHSAASRDLVARLTATTYFDRYGEVASSTDVATAIRRGEVSAGLVIPPRFGADLDAGRAVTAQLVVDGSDPLTVGSAINAAVGLGMARSSALRVEQLGVRNEPFSIEPAVWFNPEQRTAIFIVPGLIGVILTLTLSMFTAMAIARERERGTIEALSVSPVRTWEMILGKIAPFVAIGYLQMTLVLALGGWLFQVPLGHQLPLLYLLALPFIAANLAVGLFISTIARTQGQAMQMAFFLLLPNILLSGFMFPFQAMPAVVKGLSQCLPLTHFLRIVRGLTLRDAGFNDVAVEFAWLCGLLVIVVVATGLKFSKRQA